MSLLLLFNPSPAILPPALDVADSGSGTGGSLAQDLTIASNSNRLLVVSIATQHLPTTDLEVSGVTYNGVALTRATFKEKNGVRSSIWYLIAPTVGTNELLITTASSLVWVAFASSSWYNMRQTSQPHTFGGNTGININPVTSLTPISNNTLIIDALSSEKVRLTLGAGQTEIATEQGLANENLSASYKILTTASQTLMDNLLETSVDWSHVAVVFNAQATNITLPSVITIPATAVDLTSATANGEITTNGGSTSTKRGFQYNTLAYPDKEVSTTGSFSAETFSQSIPGLTPNTKYYFRAFATNAVGTTYGEWLNFTTDPATYNVSIAGVDRTDDIVNESIFIEDLANDEASTLRLQLIDRSDIGFPSNDAEIIITLDSGIKLFGGYITNIGLNSVLQTGVVQATIEATDYVWLLDRNLVNKSYESMTDKAIIEDLIATYASGSGITTTNVLSSATITQISFNYTPISQAIRRISELTGQNWYIDYDKDIHYVPLTTDPTPFNITTTNGQFSNLNINKDSTQIKNRIYVRGGTKLSDFATFSELGDGEKIKFNLPDKPHNVTLEVNRGAGLVTETVGIKNINTTGYDWYLNFQEKYVEQDSGGVVLGATDIIKLTYKYDIPILVARDNQASIIAHGVREFAIFDQTISTSEAARDRALAEITDYANNLIEGSFETFEPGFVSGQYININHSAYGINDDYLVQSVTSESLGAGLYGYTIKIVSAKTMGIIRFLIKLLEDNKNVLDIDSNEVVDELLTITDSLLSDSLIDSLTIDSAGPYATWASDSLETTPSTIAKWGLFQWG